MLSNQVAIDAMHDGLDIVLQAAGTESRNHDFHCGWYGWMRGENVEWRASKNRIGGP